MNRPSDAIEMLRRANPVPADSIDDATLPTVDALRAAWRSTRSTQAPRTPPTRTNGSATVVSPPRPADRPRRWPMYAATGALAAGVVALLVVPADPETPVEPGTTMPTPPSVVDGRDPTDVDEPSVPGDPTVTIAPTTTIPPEPSFVGSWVSTDTDGSFQIMELTQTDGDNFDLVMSDDSASVCFGAPSTMIGTGQLRPIGTLVFPQPVLTCDDGTTPEIEGSSVDVELANLTFVHDPQPDTLADSLGVFWQRATFDADGNAMPPEGSPAAARVIMARLIDALSAAGADDSFDANRVLDVFAADAAIESTDDVGGSSVYSVDEPGVLVAWMGYLQTWGFDATVQSCEPEDDRLVCVVRTRWRTLSAEADDTWSITVVGDRIRLLTIFSGGERFGDPGLPLSLDELDDWETWLRDTDPAKAERLLTPADRAGRPVTALTYDQLLAGEISASILQYLEQRPPGDEITITPDLVDLGDRLVGNVAVTRTGDRTYVLAGRYDTESDRLLPPETAVLAAFDAAGTELWRTALDGTPQDVAAVAGNVWVMGLNGILSLLDAANGAVLGELTIGDPKDVTAAFESIWIQTLGTSENRAQLVRVDASDLSTTAVDLPEGDTVNFATSAPTAGAGAMWVPLATAGLARIDPVTLELTVLSAEQIGHEVLHLAFDGEVAFVASDSQVTSIVDGQVRATASTDDVWYLGPVDGAFGMLGPGGRFDVLTADEPMLIGARQTSIAERFGPVVEIDGEAWTAVSDDLDLQRIQFSE